MRGTPRRNLWLDQQDFAQQEDLHRDGAVATPHSKRGDVGVRERDEREVSRPIHDKFVGPKFLR